MEVKGKFQAGGKRILLGIELRFLAYSASSLATINSELFPVYYAEGNDEEVI
jgi:hypothetical protein